MMTPEAKVKAKVKKQLGDIGAYQFSPIGGPYAKAGVPDIVGCYKGFFFAIECKAGKGKTTALQERELKHIRDAGGVAFVVNEENVDAVASLIKLASPVRPSNGES
jgi:penicillin-binding protein-related factor A (putative recombinase)